MQTNTEPRTPRQKRLDRLDRLADGMDSRFRVPVLGLRFGWDSILGLVPGIGDAVTLAPGAYIVYEAAQMGVRGPVLTRMAANVAFDALIGSVPLVGDAFDVVFKSNRRNIALLKREVARMEAEEVMDRPPAYARPRRPAARSAENYLT